MLFNRVPFGQRDIKSPDSIFFTEAPKKCPLLFNTLFKNYFEIRYVGSSHLNVIFIIIII